eukprot:Plantae.Rhodophyta-Hildenbrandia_rubra.ctg3072.p1 GENE.Plantae.Rhodophyta-Hildenbrandia_rubra.ctg3072~~Plantae.Rhodophyta-Hildenbrandia_rubra.ctg3072.p1  ORF type:complete len:1410 (-),score=252.22 Plantae.Rhodophyta-Hildenbrandia_rubra.ctg3072:2431-6660(-)
MSSSPFDTSLKPACKADTPNSAIKEIIAGKHSSVTVLAVTATFELLKASELNPDQLGEEFLRRAFAWFVITGCGEGMDLLFHVMLRDGGGSNLSSFLRSEVGLEQDVASAVALEALVGYAISSEKSNREDYESVLLTVLKASCSDNTSMRVTARNCAMSMKESLENVFPGKNGEHSDGALTLQTVKDALSDLQKHSIESSRGVSELDYKMTESDIFESGILAKYDWSQKVTSKTIGEIVGFVLKRAIRSSESWSEKVKSLRYIRGKQSDADSECKLCLVALNEGIQHVRGRAESGGERNQANGLKGHHGKIDSLAGEDIAVFEFILLAFERIDRHFEDGENYDEVVSLLAEVICTQYTKPYSLPVFLYQPVIYAGFRLVVTSEITDQHKKLISQLILCASNSSPGGSFAFLLLQSFPRVSRKHLYSSISSLRDLLKSRSRESGKKHKSHADENEDTGTGKVMEQATAALELMIRLNSKPLEKHQKGIQKLRIMSASDHAKMQSQSEMSEEALALLFNTLKNIVRVAAGDLDDVVTGLEYNLHLVLSAIESLIGYLLLSAKLTSALQPSHIELIAQCIKYSLENSEARDPMKVAISASSVSVIVAMSRINPKLVAENCMKIFDYLAEQGGPANVESIEKLVSNLSGKGLDLKQLVADVTTIVYSKPRKEVERKIILICVDAANDKTVAITAFMKALASAQLDWSYVEEICDVLESSKLPLLDQLSVLEKQSQISALAAVYFSRDSVLEAILALQSSRIDEGGDQANESGIIVPLQRAFTDKMTEIMEKVLLDPSDDRDSALGSLFGVSVVEVFLNLLQKNLDAEHWEVVSEGLNTLASRIDLTHVPLYSITSADADSVFVNGVTNFVNRVLKLEENSISQDEDKDAGNYWLLKQRACIVLWNTCVRLNHVSNEGAVISAKLLVKELKATPVSFWKLSHADKSAKDKAGHQAFIASAVLTLANIIGTYGNRTVASAPTLMAACADIISSLETFPSKKLVGSKNLPMLAAALQALETLTKNAPEFMPIDAVKKIFITATSTQAAEVRKVCRMMCVDGKPSVALSAVMAAVESVDVASSVCYLFELAREVVSSMRRSEVKRQANFLMRLLLKGVGFRRICKTKGSEDSDQFNSDARMVEESASELAVAWALRLPESEFKNIALKVQAWGFEEEEDKTLRLIGMFRVVLKWFVTLKALFSSYFTGILDETLSLLERPPHGGQKQNGIVKAGSSVSKKRSREEMEQDPSNYELQNLSLKCLVEYLRHVNATDVSDDTMAKIASGILTTFDSVALSSLHDYSVTFEAMTVLGERIVANGAASESREESRQMLMSVSRDILKRMTSVDWQVREAVAVSARKFALGAGEEYLAALPEVMQPLSEFLEDEVAAVVEAGRSLITTLEELSGEKIMEQLKG